jgi:hypothetical protein
VSLFAAVFTTLWQEWFSGPLVYLDLPPPMIAKEITLLFFTWFLVLMNFVSIAIIVTLEMVKYF